MHQPPDEQRFDTGDMGDVFDTDVEGLPQMPPQDDVGWLRTTGRRPHAKGTGASKPPRPVPRPRPRPRKK